MTLTEFLAARLDEDEALAHQATGPDWEVGDVILTDYDPARVLAEVESKRRIAGRRPNECSGYETQADSGGRHYPDPEYAGYCEGCAAAEAADHDHIWILKALALPYADHPDYDEAWRL